MVKLKSKKTKETAVVTQRFDQWTQNQRFVKFGSFALKPRISPSKQL